MTKGSSLEDTRSSTTTDNGVGLVGHFYQRTWNGADNPKGLAPRYNADKFFRGLRYASMKPPARARQLEHPYTMTLDEFRDNVLSYSRNGLPFKTGTFENSFGPPSGNAEWTSNDEIALINKLRGKIQGSDFNIGVFLAEGHEALETIADVASRLYSAYKAASHGNFARAAKSVAGYKPRPSRSRSREVAKNAADNWNGAQYGVIPMLNDVKDAAEFLDHIYSTPPQQTYTAQRTKRGSVTASNVVFGDPHLYSVKIKAIVRSIDFVRLSGLTDPASVVWEKIPYSFVADWFVPVGNYLSALNVARSLQATYVRTAYARFNVSALRCKWPNGWVVNDSLYHRTQVTLRRTVTSQLDVPAPSSKGVNKAFSSWKHAVNAVSLLTSAAFR